MKMLFCLALIFLCPLCCYAGANSFVSSSIQQEEEAKIRELYATMYSFMISKNIKKLGELLDNSFVLVHMTGMRQNKSDYLSAIEHGVLNYFSEKLDYIEVTINNNQASLIGRSQVNAAVFGGGHRTWRLELDIDLIKKNGQWLMTKAKASTY